MAAQREGEAVVLPERVEGGGVVLRRWRVDDTENMRRAVLESLEHLRPWMPWIAEEPRSLADRRAMVAGWEREWARGGDVFLAVLLDDRVAGSTGLHRRRGPGVLEIGYWIHPAFLRRGVATTVVRLLTDAAFTVPGIERVEIHHDKANAASAGVPAKLGYTKTGEQPGAPIAPAEVGIDCGWAMRREDWVGRPRP